MWTKKDKDVFAAYKKHQALYEAGQPEISDAAFDRIEDHVLTLFETPPLTAKGDTPLAYHMPSLTKVKTDKQVRSFCAKHKVTFMLSEKLDGIAFQYANVNGRPTLTTRGDGTKGKDLTRILPVLNLPELESGQCVVGELIISLKDYNLFASEFRNPRQLVSGVTNSGRKTLHKATAYLHAVAFEIVGERTTSPDVQLRRLAKQGFTVPKHLKVDNLDNLPATYRTFLENRVYALDGVVIQFMGRFPRVTKGNPEYACAYKETLEVETTTVTKIHWSTGRTGRVTPTIEVEPIELGGVTIRRAPAFNARYVMDEGLGVGAEVILQRSGEVIPNIIEVVKSVEPDMPNTPYIWDGAHILAQDHTQKLKRIDHFYQTLGVEGLRLASIEKFGDCNLSDFIHYTEDHLVAVLGANGAKVYEQLETLRNTPQDLARLMDASSLFTGLAYATFVKLFNVTQSKTPSLQTLLTIPDWGVTTATTYLNNLPEFKALLKATGLTYYVPKITECAGTLSGIVVILTGLRCTELSQSITSNGGKIANSFTKEVNVCIAPKGFKSSKTRKAQSLDLPILTPDEFNLTYLTGD